MEKKKYPSFVPFSQAALKFADSVIFFEFFNLATNLWYIFYLCLEYCAINNPGVINDRSYVKYAFPIRFFLLYNATNEKYFSD